MEEERIKDFEVRLRKVEDFIMGQLNMLIDLSQSFKARIDTLEDHDKEFMAMVHSSCALKDKEIQKAREDAIEISCEHADKNHFQTWKVLAFVSTIVIGCIVYFNIENNTRALDIKKHETQIDNISKTLDKIDNKMDKIMSRIATEDKE